MCLILLCNFCFSVGSTDVPLIDLTTSPEEKKQIKDKTFKTEFDVFDSLYSTTNQALCGNLDLPLPLLNDTEPDPFDVRAHRHMCRQESRGMTDSSSSGYKSDSEILGSLNSSGVFSAESVSISSSLTHKPQAHLSQNASVQPENACNTSDWSSQKTKDTSKFCNASQMSQVTAASLSANTECRINSQPSSHDLIYCEPPSDDIYCPPSKPRSAVASSDQTPKSSHHLPGRMQDINRQTPNKQPISGSHLSSEEHPVNTEQTNWMSRSICLPLKLPPPPRSQSQGRNQLKLAQNLPKQPAAKPDIQEPSQEVDRDKAEKAFDWINDALKSNLGPQPWFQNKEFLLFLNKNNSSQPSMQKSHSFPLYDSVPDETDLQVKDQVQEILADDRAFKSTNLSQFSEDKYFDVKHYSHTHQDKCGPEYSSTHEDTPDVDSHEDSSSFSDSTFDDDEDYDAQETFVQHVELNSQPPTNTPPPLPPRTYNTNASKEKITLNKPYILPLKQDGQQLSHTHYFLIPYLNEQRHRSNHQRDKPSPQKATATVKPFAVNSAFSIKDERDDCVGYENLTGLIHRDVIQHSLSNMSTSSKSSTGSGGLESCSPKYQQQPKHCHQMAPRSLRSYNSALHPVSPQRNIAENEEEGTFVSSSPRERIAVVRNQVIGVTDDECYTALSTTHWEVDSAVKYLKVEQLFRLGVASRESCQKLLETLGWNLERASSVVVDRVRRTRMKSGSTYETAV